MEGTQQSLTMPDNWKKSITLFLSSQTISIFGSAIVQFAIIWYITLETKSGVMMTIGTICGFVPQLVIALFAGVWADRYSRKFLIILGDAITALFTLFAAIVFLIGYKELWVLFAASAIRAFGSGIQSPAVSAIIPQIVPSDRLMKINGLNSSIMSMVMLIAPAVSGAILSFFQLQIIFFIDMVTAILAIVIMTRLKISRHLGEGKEQANGVFREIKEGLQYLNSSLWMKELFVFFAIFMFMLAPVAFLTPLMVARTFGPEVWRLTLNEILFSGGAIIGGVLIGFWGGFRNKVYTIAASGILFGIFTAAMGLDYSFVFYLAMMLLSGVSMPFFNTPSMVILQEKVPQNVQGRIFSIIQIISTSVMPIGMIVFGPISDVVRVELLLIITGLLVVVISVVMLFMKNLLAVGAPDGVVPLQDCEQDLLKEDQ